MIDEAILSSSSSSISFQRSSSSSRFFSFSSIIPLHLRSFSKWFTTSCHESLPLSFFFRSNKMSESNLKNGFVPKMMSSSSSPSFFYYSTFQEMNLNWTIFFFYKGRIRQSMRYLCIYGQSRTSSGSKSPNWDRP